MPYEEEYIKELVNIIRLLLPLVNPTNLTLEQLHAIQKAMEVTK